MRKYDHLVMLCLLLCVACKSGKVINTKPDWVQSRPTNDQYYIGIGIASKTNNPFDYQQVAKKNAVNDLISEIKITVSSNSVLSQFQNNTEFKQQFESDIKITAINTIEQFNVVSSWEDKDFFWIYYKLSKEDFKEAKRRKLNAAIEQAENYFTKAESFPPEQFNQSVRLKVKALAVLQLYLNEDVQTVYNGKNVYLVNEIMNSIQNQLYEVELVSSVSMLKGKVGRSISDPFDITAQYRNNHAPIPFVPLTSLSENNGIEATISAETDQKGTGSVAITKIAGKAPVQQIRIAVDIAGFMKADSLNQTLQTILGSLDAPATTVRLNVIPIRIYIESDEQNLSRKMPSNYLELALKKELSKDGCSFVDTKTDADYCLNILANTRSAGTIWGNMKAAGLNMSISLIEEPNHVEVYKDGFSEVKGFQLTEMDAGLDAYKTATEQMIYRMYPSLKNEIMGRTQGNKK
jgi:hypothetical protein